MLLNAHCCLAQIISSGCNPITLLRLSTDCRHRLAAGCYGIAHIHGDGRRDLARDDLHADGCDTRSLDGGEYFTVLGYPHLTWDSRWGGHTEFAARRCGDKEMSDAELASRTAAVLRVAPLPHRTVVFEGQLLHRATWPTTTFADQVAVEGAGGGERGSTVMQLVCWRNRELMSPVSAAGGHEDL